MTEKPEQKTIDLEQVDYVQEDYDPEVEKRIVRSNIGNAKLGGLEEDLNLTPQQYQWSLSIFYFGYVIFDVPSNIVLRRWRPSTWLGLIMFLWGVTATAMAGAKDFATLATGRIFLGVFEAGQISQTTLHTWQWLFLIEGLPSVVCAVAAIFILPDDPETCKFLTEDERVVAVGRLAKDAGASNSHSFSWAQVISVLYDWKTWVYSMIYITGTSALQGVTLFLPSIIKQMGHWGSAEAQALTTPPYFLAFLATVALSWSSDKFFERSFHMIFSNCVGLVGFFLLMFVDHSNLGVHYFATCLVTMGLYANVSIKAAWFNNNFNGLTRRAVGSAIIISIGTIGGAIGGQIYYDPADNYFHGNLIAVCLVVAQSLLVIGTRLYLMYENKRRSALTDEAKELEIEKYGGIDLAGDRNPDFRYVL
ncbi:MFS general substrate transporter [Hesseltinella vesiculosa]|uniref:MFS general substrate transporter n=1 Tax=Hesseltinella vesiculosa TaxID=101127 RepID=A0A1X2GUC2_9FUNG|nr:MFS general substrate transporter [Hesseltinella vesiculosa]